MQRRALTANPSSLLHTVLGKLHAFFMLICTEKESQKKVYTAYIKYVFFFYSCIEGKSKRPKEKQVWRNKFVRFKNVGREKKKRSLD